MVLYVIIIIMNYDISKLDYSIVGEGMPVLLLHGWGGNKDSFSPVTKYLPPKYKLISLSLPGFGGSPEPEAAWSVQDYADLVSAFIAEKLSAEERGALLCITHSYGGRLAGKLKNFKKLVQIASAGIKPKRSLKYHIGLFFYKLLKGIAAIPFVGAPFQRPHRAHRALRGSDDYNNATPVMQQALTMAVNHDQRRDFAQITCPTLIIWGESDSTTPIWMGYEMEKLIQGSALITYSDGSHRVHYDHAAEVAIVIDNFFSNEDFAKNTEIEEAAQ